MHEKVLVCAVFERECVLNACICARVEHKKGVTRGVSEDSLGVSVRVSQGLHHHGHVGHLVLGQLLQGRLTEERALYSAGTTLEAPGR